MLPLNDSHPWTAFDVSSLRSLSDSIDKKLIDIGHPCDADIEQRDFNIPPACELSYTILIEDLDLIKRHIDQQPQVFSTDLPQYALCPVQLAFIFIKDKAIKILFESGVHGKILENGNLILMVSTIEKAVKIYDHDSPIGNKANSILNYLAEFLNNELHQSKHLETEPHTACNTDHPEIRDASFETHTTSNSNLIKALSFKDENHSTLLHYACRLRSQTLVRTILNTEPGIESLCHQDKYGSTPMIYACLSRDENIINDIIQTDRGKESLTIQNKHKESPIMTALKNKQFSLANSILNTQQGIQSVAEQKYAEELDLLHTLKELWMDDAISVILSNPVYCRNIEATVCRLLKTIAEEQKLTVLTKTCSSASCEHLFTLDLNAVYDNDELQMPLLEDQEISPDEGINTPTRRQLLTENQPASTPGSLASDQETDTSLGTKPKTNESSRDFTYRDKITLIHMVANKHKDNTAPHHSANLIEFLSQISEENRYLALTMQDSNGCTILHIACKNNDQVLLKGLLRLPDDIIQEG